MFTISREFGRVMQIFLNLEIPADIKNNGNLIKFIRKNVEKTLETELETMTHEQFLQNMITYLTIDPPPFERDNAEEEIIELEKLCNELKVKQETELQELKAKLIEAKKKVTKPSDTEWGEMAYKSPTEIAKQSAKFPVTKENEHEKLSNSTILKREFKISGTIGEPGQTERLSFLSLTHQIDSGIKREYKKNCPI